MNKIFIILILCVSSVFAQELSIRTGLGRGDVSNQKYFSVGYYEPIFRFVSLGAEVGGINNRNYLVASWNPFVMLGTEILVENSVLYGRLGLGFAVLNKPERTLPTRFQVANTVAFGVTSGAGKIGLIFRHFSNGSASPKNKGFDLFGIEFSRSFQ